jgi:hypothetical protein
MKRIAGNGKWCLKTITEGCAYANKIFVVTEGLDFSNKGLLLLVGDYPIRQLSMKRILVGWLSGN